MKGSISRLWQTCRVIANENRLRFLWLIFTNPNQCVGDLAKAIGITPATASNQLKILCDEGFISAHRSRQQVRYNAEFQDAPSHILHLQAALKKSCHDAIPFHTIIHQATGFTHQRRIELLRKIASASVSLNELAEQTVISYPALNRHLVKLEARNYITLNNGRYTLSKSKEPLPKALSKIIIC
ncbi:MAG: ArsR family transcriptional regulator [Kiritimatiellales bacterium]